MRFIFHIIKNRKGATKSCALPLETSDTRLLWATIRPQALHATLALAAAR
jgi:hypothetical protein